MQDHDNGNSGSKVHVLNLAINERVARNSDNDKDTALLILLKLVKEG